MLIDGSNQHSACVFGKLDLYRVGFTAVQGSNKKLGITPAILPGYRQRDLKLPTIVIDDRDSDTAPIQVIIGFDGLVRCRKLAKLRMHTAKVVVIGRRPQKNSY